MNTQQNTEGKGLRINQSHLNSLTPMQRGRVEKTLSQKYNTCLGIMTLREYLESGRFTKVEKAEVPAVEWNRRKYNRMDAREQAVYEKRLDDKKTEYRAVTDDDTFYRIPKIVYNVLQSC